MNRRDFLLMSLQLSFVPLELGALESCADESSGYGGDGSGSPIKQGGDCKAHGTAVAIQEVHTPNHMLDVPAVDVIAGVDKVYVLADNGSGHTHTVNITAANFVALQNNGGVVETTTLEFGHAHNVIVNCVLL